VDDERHLSVGQAIEHKPGGHAVGIGFDRDAGVEPLLVQIVEDRPGRRGQYLKANARKDRLQIAEQPRHEHLRHAGADADGQRVRGRPAQAPRGVGQTQQIAGHALGFIEEGAALLGQFDAARGAPEQREADFLFQQAHLLAHRGLRNIQPRGSLGEAPLLGDRQRIANFAEFHSMFRGAAPLQRPPTMMENRSRANPPGPAELGIFHLTWAKPPNGERVISGGASSGNRPQWG